MQETEDRNTHELNRAYIGTGNRRTCTHADEKTSRQPGKNRDGYRGQWQADK